MWGLELLGVGDKGQSRQPRVSSRGCSAYRTSTPTGKHRLLQSDLSRLDCPAASKPCKPNHK